MNYPEYVKINEKTYKINVDFRVAIECNDIALNCEISDYERALAIIYKLFGEEGLDNYKDYEKLLEAAKKFLSCNQEVDAQSNEEPDMDFKQDIDYIEASFMSDYNIDLSSIEMHWWKFYKLMNGLSNSDFGNCCVLNRVRNLRTFDTKDIKDPKELAKIKDAQKKVALKRQKRKINFNEEEIKERINNINSFYEKTGIKRKE